MPRRNRREVPTPKQRRRAPERELTYEQMATSLVKRGLSPITTLDRPITNFPGVATPQRRPTAQRVN